MNIVICEDSISDRHKLEKAITKVLIKNLREPGRWTACGTF